MGLTPDQVATLEMLNGQAAAHYRAAASAPSLEQRVQALRDAQDATDAGSNFAAYKRIQQELSDAVHEELRAPADLQRAIQADTRATARVLAYLDQLGVEHSGAISGATLAAVCGVVGIESRFLCGGPGPEGLFRRGLAEPHGDDALPSATLVLTQHGQAFREFQQRFDAVARTVRTDTDPWTVIFHGSHEGCLLALANEEACAQSCAQNSPHNNGSSSSESKN